MKRRTLISGLAACGAAAALDSAAVEAQPAAGWIDVHHHFAPPDWLPLADKANPSSIGVWRNWSLQDALAQMQAAGVQKAMLSITTPGIDFGDQAANRKLARYCNEYAAQLAKDHPGRFGRFVALPLPDIDGSLAEIAYGLDTLKADGVGVFTSYGNTWWGDPKFAPVYEELNRRGSVIFVHPTSPQCCTNLVNGISDADVEYGTDTTRAIAETIFSGTSTKYPRMRIIWSHAGGTMPFLDWRFLREGERSKYKPLLPNGYLPEAQKFYYDTAQAAVAPPMLALSKIVPLSHILFGTDLPYLSIRECVEGMRNCGVFTPGQLTTIGQMNAVALFGPS